MKFQKKKRRKKKNGTHDKKGSGKLFHCFSFYAFDTLLLLLLLLLLFSFLLFHFFFLNFDPSLETFLDSDKYIIIIVFVFFSNFVSLFCFILIFLSFIFSPILKGRIHVCWYDEKDGPKRCGSKKERQKSCAYFRGR